MKPDFFMYIVNWLKADSPVLLARVPITMGYQGEGQKASKLLVDPRAYTPSISWIHLFFFSSDAEFMEHMEMLNHPFTKLVNRNEGHILINGNAYPFKHGEWVHHGEEKG